MQPHTTSSPAAHTRTNIFRQLQHFARSTIFRNVKIYALLLCVIMVLGGTVVLRVATENGLAIVFPTVDRTHLQSSFSHDSLPGPVGKVAFTGSASGGEGPYTYSWNLGDTNTALGQVTTHSYSSIGTFMVSLTVTDSIGNSVVSSQTVRIANIPTLHVKGPNIVDNNNDTVRLVGLNYGDYPNDVFPNQFNTGNLTRDAVAIRSAGFNVVNLVEEWGSLENSSSSSTYSYTTSPWNLLQARITALTGQGIYTIIKLHADADNSTDHRNLLNFLGSSQYCDSNGDFLTAMGDSFYSTSANSNRNSGIAHMTSLWLKISSLTKNNSLVVGLDLLNEPWYCPSTKLSLNQIHDYWHSRVTEMTNAIRSNGDNRIIFVEEAPNYDGYAYFRAYPDPNTVSSIHWYRGEHKTNDNGSWTACNGDYPTLYAYFSDTPPSSNGACSSQPADSIVQARHNYPNQAFMIGEFGNIYDNKPRDKSQQWITESIRLFKDQKMAGWIYWSSGDTGSWVNDLGAGQSTGKAIPGDLNHDGIVNIIDIGMFSRAWLSTPGSPRWNPEADLNNDRVVNIVDFGMLLENYSF